MIESKFTYDPNEPLRVRILSTRLARGLTGTWGVSPPSSKAHQARWDHGGAVTGPPCHHDAGSIGPATRVVPKESARPC